MKIGTRLATALAIIAVFSFGCAGMGSHGGKRPAPDFSVKLVSGGSGDKQVSLDRFRGRPLVLNIGAIWCPHCLHELPAFSAAYEKHKGDAEFLVVFIKSERDAIDDAVRDGKLPFMVGHDESSGIGKAYGIKAIPVTLFIDADGMITDEYVGGISESRLLKKTEELIARSRAAAR